MDIPVMSTVAIFSAVYARVPSGAPDPSDAKRVVATWIEDHCGDPLRSGLRAYIESPLFDITVLPAESFPAPPPKMLSYMGMTEGQERALGEASHVLLIRTSDANAIPRMGLWASVAAARSLPPAYGGPALDPVIPRLYPEAGSSNDLPADGTVSVAEHIVVPMSVDERGLAWITTSGLLKFGLPDLSIRDVPPNLDKLSHLVNAIAQALVERVLRLAYDTGTPPDVLSLEPDITVTVSHLIRSRGKRPDDAEPDRISTRVGLRLTRREGDSPAMLQVVPPADFPAEHGVWLAHALSEFLGMEPNSRAVPVGSELMEIAHRRAVAELPAVRARFQAGMKPGQQTLIKHGFAVNEDLKEFIWVAVNQWDGGVVVGQVANQPQQVAGLLMGQTVRITEADVFDWVIVGPGEEMQGAYTDRAAEHEARG